ncbi:MAG: hypothetical protein V3W20_10685 [Candidatus Neomarinimicrobiota bacterium]
MSLDAKESIQNTRVQVLIWAIFSLGVILSFITGIHEVRMFKMPETYVQKEDYNRDSDRREARLIRMEDKIDDILIVLPRIIP